MVPLYSGDFIISRLQQCSSLCPIIESGEFSTVKAFAFCAANIVSISGILYGFLSTAMCDPLSSDPVVRGGPSPSMPQIPAQVEYSFAPQNEGETMSTGTEANYALQEEENSF